jgi:hypothetical protein
MSWFGISNLEGNVKRMQEMKAGGAGPLKIRNTFRKEGIEIETHQVKAILESADNLRVKALPKKVAKQVIEEMKEVKNQGTDTLPDSNT